MDTNEKEGTKIKNMIYSNCKLSKVKSSLLCFLFILCISVYSIMVSQNNTNNNEQEEIFRFGNEIIQDGLERAERSVLIRIFWDQPRNRMFVQNSLNQLWHYDGSIQVLEVGFGLLQVVFPSVEAMNWVLDRRPWSLAMNVMNMIPFAPPSVEIFNELQFMAVWIKLSRVPSQCITTRFGKEFLTFFGEVLDISLFGSRGRDAIFIKGLVMIDLLAPFLGRRQACGPDNIPFWVRLHYENISLICYRCGLLGHSFSRCPHTHIPVDHEARGSWMSIGKVGFRIVENSLQKYMQNQLKAKRKESGQQEIGQFSFVTKEKRFGYTVQPAEDEPGMEDKEIGSGSSTAPKRQSALPPQNKKYATAGSKLIMKGNPPPSDGFIARTKHAPMPQQSAPAALRNEEVKKKTENLEGKGGFYIPPGRRLIDRNGAFSSSKNDSSAAAPPRRSQSVMNATQQHSAAKRKLTYEAKGKGKQRVDTGPVSMKKWIPSKGITIREPNSLEAIPRSSSSNLPMKNQVIKAPTTIPGPSKVGNWIEPKGMDKAADKEVDFPHKCFERKSYSLELIRNMYQQEEEEEQDDVPAVVTIVKTAPPTVQPFQATSPTSSVNQPIREPSHEDIEWLRPVVGRWGDISDDDEDDEDAYGEQDMGVEEESLIQANEPGDEEEIEDN
ncbi:hypothetical protein LINPERPRIM_LOCUS7677 [Linum perenne]